MVSNRPKRKVRCNECGDIVKAKNYHLATYHDYDYHELLWREEKNFFAHREWLEKKFSKVDQGERLYYNKIVEEEKKIGPVN